MNCLGSMLKYIIYVFNLIFLVCGVLLIVFGSLMISNIGDFTSFEYAYNTETIPILIIVLGCIIFVISFFGCCGAIKENNCCTIIYAIFMFILLGLQLALVIWMFVERDEFLKTMDNVVQEAWNKNDQANGFPMNALQMSFKCCGLDRYTDYTNMNVEVPNSCCGSMTNVCPSEVYITRPGCRFEFREFWTSNIDIIRYAGLGVALIELVVMVFACCLASSIRKSHREGV